MHANALRVGGTCSLACMHGCLFGLGVGIYCCARATRYATVTTFKLNHVLVCKHFATCCRTAPAGLRRNRMTHPSMHACMYAHAHEHNTMCLIAIHACTYCVRAFVVPHLLCTLGVSMTRSLPTVVSAPHSRSTGLRCRLLKGPKLAATCRPAGRQPSWHKAHSHACTQRRPTHMHRGKCTTPLLRAGSSRALNEIPPYRLGVCGCIAASRGENPEQRQRRDHLEMHRRSLIYNS